MTILQKIPEMGPLNKLDAVEALRSVNEWEASHLLSGTVRIKIFRNYSTEFIEPFLKYYFGTLGLSCEVQFGGYDSFRQDALNDTTLQSYDLIVLSLLADGLIAGRQDTVAVEEAFAGVAGVIEHLCANASAPVIVNTLIRPLLDEGGPVRAVQPDSLTSRVEQFNRHLRQHAAQNGPRCLVVDWERLIMMMGADAALDRRMAYMASAPFRHGFLNLYAHEIFRIGRILRGKGKKCLVLDCDNTLWGGIVGEAGIEGIALEPNEYPGKAFYDFQKAIVRLAEQGVMVALCSKNNADDVMAVLDRHPHCLIKRHHLVAHRIGWDDKERSLEELVADLNIGMDAVVFVDDSPVECARVATFLPQIAVRQVPDRLYDLPLLLDREGLFDKLATTREDLSRTAMYRSEQQRRGSESAFATGEEFLASLDLTAKIRRAREADIARISQLTQKTNQFNLTTKRYSEGDIARMLADSDFSVYALSASDRFGDLGLVGVLIAQRQDRNASVDTLLMSCRALGRRLEDQFVAHCLENLTLEWTPVQWKAGFIRTTKNAQVEEFWPKFGFNQVGASDSEKFYGAQPGELILPAVPFVKLEVD